MNFNRPELVRALTAAATLVFVVGVIGAFTVESDDTNVAASRDGASSTSSTTVESTSTTGFATATTVATGTSTTRPNTTATTVAPNVPDPGPTRPPAPGTYLYTFSNTVDPSLNGNNERKVEEVAPENGVPRRRTTQRDAQGNTLVNDEVWASDAVRVTASHIGSPQGSVDCTWQPPLLALQLPLAIGKTWKTESSCTTTVSGTQVTIRRVGESKVTGKVLDKVGDTSIAVWVIESTGTTTVRSAFYNDDTRETVNAHFASSRGLTTRETGTIEGASRKGSYDLTLQSLTPK